VASVLLTRLKKKNMRIETAIKMVKLIMMLCLIPVFTAPKMALGRILAPALLKKY